MEMNNKNTKCLHVLHKSGADKIFEAYKWVQEHRHDFNKEVFGPVLVEVKIFEIHAVIAFELLT